MPERLKLLPPIGRYFMQLRPMEPRSAAAPFNSEGHYFQIKWDGVRIIAFLEKGGRVRLQNRRLHDRTLQYPELQCLPELVTGTEAILDGELVVLEGGKPSFARVLRRDFCRKERSIRELAGRLPGTYCIFDLLYLDGDDLTGLPLSERLAMLAKSVRAEAPVYINDNFSSGIDLYQQIAAQGLEGIVAKDKQGPYLPGIKSDNWLKIKPRRRQLCVVGGLAVKQGAVGALLLGCYSDGRLVYVGRAGSGLSRSDQVSLRDHGSRSAVIEPPFANPPRGKGYLWLEPRLTAIIEFAEWTENLHLRAPVVIGFSDRPPEEAEL